MKAAESIQKEAIANPNHPKVTIEEEYNNDKRGIILKR